MPPALRPLYLPGDTLKRSDDLAFQNRTDRDLWDFAFRANSEAQIDKLGQGLAEPAPLPMPEISQPDPLPIVVSPRPEAQIPNPQPRGAPAAMPSASEGDPSRTSQTAPPSGIPDAQPPTEGGAGVATPAAMPQVSARAPNLGSGTRGQKQARIYEVARASGLDDEGARVLVAVTETEGGLEGAIGDQGRSRGPFQFYEGGQMPGFRAWLGQQGVQGDPNTLVHDVDLATRYAASGYLGRAIAAGRAAGLRGADLATYVQEHGQVSVDPWKTGQNYQRLFGGSGAPAPNASGPPLAGPPPSPPAVSAPTSPQAAGGSDLVTIQHVDDLSKRQTVPRSQVPDWLRDVYPGSGPLWRVVDSPQAQMSALDETRASTGGGQGVMMRAQSGTGVPMPGSVDEQATGGVPGLGEGDRSDVPPSIPYPLRYPVDYRERGEQPYDATDDEGLDRTNDPLMEEPGQPGRMEGLPERGQVQLYRQPLSAQPELPTDDRYDPDAGPRETGYTLPGSQPSAVAPTGPSSAISARQADGASSQASAEEEAGYQSQQPLPIQIGQGGPAPEGAQYTEVATRPRQAPQLADTGERFLDQSLPSPPGWQAIVDSAGQVVDWVRERAQATSDYLNERPYAGVPTVQGFPGEPDYQSAVTRQETAQRRADERAQLPVGERLQRDLGAAADLFTGPPSPEMAEAGSQLRESVRGVGEPIIRPVEQAIGSAAGTAEQALGAPPGSVRQAAEDVSNVFPAGPALGVVRRGAGASDPMSVVAQRVAKFVKGDQDEADRLVGEFKRLMDSSAAPSDFAAFWRGVEENQKIKPSEVFSLFRRFNMLSGPRTFEVNGLSGALNLGYEVLSSSAGQAARGRIPEAAAEAAAPLKAAGRAFGNLIETMQHGVTTEQAMRGDIPSTLSSRTDNPAAKGALTVMEIPDRLNAAVDQFFRTMTEDWAATRLAHEQARKVGLTPRSPKWAETVVAKMDEIRADPAQFPQLKEMADRVTFAEEPGGLVKWLEDGKRKYPNIVGVIAPFIRTPANIASRAVDMSPLGPVRTAIEAGTGLGRGTKQLPERVRDNVLGVAGSVWAYNLAEQGVLTGAGPDDPEKLAMLRATGWQPYSVRLENPVSGKTEYWSYANFAPFSLMLSAGAAASEAQKYAKPGKTDPLSILADGAARTGKVVSNMTVLAGLGAIVKSIEDPDRYGGAWLSQTLQQLIPAGSFINTIGQATDPYIRRAERDTFANQVGGQLLSRIPPNPITPDRTDVPVAQDPLGRAVPNDMTGAGALNPFRPTPERPDPVLQPFIDAKVDIGRPRENLTIAGVSVPLTVEEQRRWNELRGQEIQKRMQTLVANGSLERMRPERRQERLEEIRDTAADQATDLLWRSIPFQERNRRRTEARKAN